MIIFTRMRIFAFLLIVCLPGLAACFRIRNDFVTPQQVHISYGENPSELIVTWSTLNDTDSIVKYGPGTPSQTAQGTSTRFESFGSEHHFQYIHKVVMTGLKTGSSYNYQCGSSAVWSQVFKTATMKAGSNWSPRIVMFGDFGLYNPQSFKSLMADKQQGMYDAVFHVGDFAYDLHDKNGSVGDKFLNMIQPLAAELPYMTCPGNHEGANNFSDYRHRFAMPGDMNGVNMFYSFDMGPIHVISISTEYYFFIQYGFWQPYRQYEWLEKDLKKAAANRATVPWIMTMGHRPMYCSNNDKDDCTKHESIVRDGIPIIHKLGLEALFHKYNVDLMVWAHEHSYERLWPVFNREVYNGSKSEPYTNPKAPVHIITGSAGCQEKHDSFKNVTENWSAFRSDDYGYTRMKVYNATHLHIEQVSDDKNGTVIDEMMLIKDTHGYGSYVGQTAEQVKLVKGGPLRFKPSL